ncbi:MAG: site-specific integrase, partial [Bacteroidales bacterium]
MERNLSDNSVFAYMRDVKHLTDFLEDHAPGLAVKDLEAGHLNHFINNLHETGISANSQARIISGLKSFFRFLLLEDIIDIDPTDFIQAPRFGQKLPDTLSYDEISKLIEAIDLSTIEGERNKAIIETLYGC